MSGDDKLLGRVRLGIEAEKFLSSDLGKHLTQKANAQIDREMKALAECSPTDIEANTRHRINIKSAQNFIVWLMEGISSGTVARNTIREEDALG